MFLRIPMERRLTLNWLIISGFQMRACLRDIRCKIEANEALNITWLWTVKVAILIGFNPPKVGLLLYLYKSDLFLNIPPTTPTTSSSSSSLKR